MKTKQLKAARLFPLLLVTVAGSFACSDAPNFWGGTVGEERSGVIVMTDKASYAREDVVLVKVENNLDEKVTTEDQQTFCSIVTLEQESQDDWQPTLPCTLNSPSREVTLEPKTETVVELTAPSSQPDQSIAPGRYRVTFTYTRGEFFRPAADETATVSSAPFVVAN